MTLPDAIREALERNAAQLSPITLTLAEYPPGYSAPEGRIDDWLVPEAVQAGEGPFPGMHQGQLLRITWQDGKFRTWRRTRSGRPESESVYESSSDGQVHYLLSRWAEGPSAMLKTRMDDPKENHPDAVLFDPTYLEACGLTMPTCGESVRSVPARSTILHQLDHGGELLAVDGNRVRIRADNPERVAAERVTDFRALEDELRRFAMSDEQIQNELAEVRRKQQLPKKWVWTFELDPEVHFAQRKIEASFEDGTLIRRMSCEDFQNIPGRDLHLPRKVAAEWFKRVPAPDENPATLSRVWELVEVESRAVDESRFVIEPEAPDTWVTDRTKPRG